MYIYLGGALGFALIILIILFKHQSDFNISYEKL